MSDPALDRVTFARDVLGLAPFPHQVEALRSPASVVVACGGRRSGKTEAAIAAALHCVTTRRDADWLVTGPNTDKVRQVVAEAADRLRRSRIGPDAAFDERAMRLDVRGSGSAIVGVPPTPGQLRGFGRRVLGLHVEEAGFCPEGLWRDARYILADRAAEGAVAWLTGSPWGDGFFRAAWRLGVDGDPDYWASDPPWRTEQNARIPREWIERERARLNGLEAAAELDGEWVDSGEAFFPRSLLERNVADLELPAFAELRGPARPAIGLDWGVAHDRSAAVLLYRLPVGRLNPGRETHPVLVAIPHVWEAGAPLGDVVSDVLGCPAPLEYLAPEVVGVGAMPSQELRRGILARYGDRMRTRWCLVATTRPIKVAAYGMLRWLLERGQLVLPRDPALLRQLAGLRLELDSRGSGAIEAADATVHDDVADALAFCALPYRPRGGGVRCELATLIGPAAPPDAEVDHTGAPTFTGGGLAVPRRPALQSLAGTALSLPPGAEDSGADGDRRLPDPRPEMVAAPAGPATGRDLDRPRPAVPLDRNRRPQGGR